MTNSQWLLFQLFFKAIYTKVYLNNVLKWGKRANNLPAV